MRAKCLLYGVGAAIGGKQAEACHGEPPHACHIHMIHVTDDLLLASQRYVSPDFKIEDISTASCSLASQPLDTSIMHQ